MKRYNPNYYYIRLHARVRIHPVEEREKKEEGRHEKEEG
jgi:hypothetical protein